MNEAKRKKQSSSAKPEAKKLKRNHVNENSTSQEMVDSTTQPSVLGSNATAGIIESLEMKNFMCHNKLQFRFGNNINFIIGKNGSGKSAVLTAVMVGLGGRAAATNRGSVVKNFIKSGENYTEIVVKLRNEGPDAFKPNVYGDLIAVHRRISIDGSSSYKIKNARGQLVSSKREELTHILDVFNIQVDNPVSILNQDTSRNFLHSKSPHDKYKFFLKATQLEQIDSDLMQMGEKKRIAVNVIDEKQQSLPTIEEEVRQWENKWRHHHTLDKVRASMDKLTDEAAWAHAIVAEQELAKKLETIEQEKLKVPKYQDKLDEAEMKVETKHKAWTDARDLLGQIMGELNLLNPQREETKMVMEATKANHNELLNRKRTIESEINSFTRDRDEIRKKKEEMRTKMDQTNSKAVEEEKVNALKRHQSELNAQRSTTEHQIEQLGLAIQKGLSDLYHARREEQDIKSQLEKRVRKLRDLEESRSNHLRRFGNYVPDLLARIDDAHRKGRFRQKPRGPLGMHLKLTESNWALAIESCLKSMLTTYACDNYDDSRVLEGIMKSVMRGSRAPSVVVSKFQHKVYNVSNCAPQTSKYTTVLNMLNIDDPVVANCLIDQRNVESILLIAANEEARSLMLSKPPNNCKEVFTLVGDQVYPSPNFRYYSSQKSRPEIMQTSVEDNIRTQKDEIVQMETRLADIKRCNIAQLENLGRSNTAELKREENRLADLRQKINRVLLELREAETDEIPDAVNFAALEEEDKGLIRQLSTLRQKQLELEQQRTAEKAKLVTIEELHQTLVTKLRTIVVDQIDAAREAESQKGREVDVAKNAQKHYTLEVKKLQSVVAKLLVDYEKSKAEVTAMVAKTEQVCPRIVTERLPWVIENEIKIMQQHLQEAERSGGNKEEVTLQYYKCKTKFQTISADVNNIKKYIENINEMIDQRQRAYKTFRQYVGMRIRYLFVINLHTCNFKGNLVFDHSTEKIDIEVVRHNQEVSSHNIGNLSGGERSYSTVCFILALWDAMDSPFRMLDEFDVYMDMVVRRLSMDMMLETAITKKDNQFIFLTPLDMSSLRYADRITIFPMEDPDRSSTQNSIQPYCAANTGDESDEDV